MAFAHAASLYAYADAGMDLAACADASRTRWSALPPVRDLSCAVAHWTVIIDATWSGPGPNTEHAFHGPSL